MEFVIWLAGLNFHHLEIWRYKYYRRLPDFSEQYTTECLNELQKIEQLLELEVSRV